MNRIDVLFGRNNLSLNHQGFGNEKQIKAKVFLADNLLCTLISEFDGSGFVFRSLEKLLPNSALKLPAFVNNSQFCQNIVQDLRIDFFQENKSDTEEYKVLIGAGVGQKRQSINTLVSHPNKFLTNQPMKKKTSLKSSEWLYFLNNYDDPKRLYIRIVAKLANGSTNTRDAFSILDSKFGVYAIDISPIYIKNRFATELAGETSIGSEIESYKVQTGIYLANIFFPLSEIREYFITADTSQATHLCFKNSFGVFDNLRLTGGQKKSQELDYNTFENEQTIYTEDVVFYDKLSLQLGEFEQNWLLYLKELPISKMIYLRTGGSYQKLTCTTKSLPFFDSSKPNDETNIEFRFSENETNYNA
jgi:hypothetical protein